MAVNYLLVVSDKNVCAEGVSAGLNEMYRLFGKREYIHRFQAFPMHLSGGWDEQWYWAQPKQILTINEIKRLKNIFENEGKYLKVYRIEEEG